MKTILFAAVIAVAFAAPAEFKLYKTYADYKSGKVHKTYQGMAGRGHVANKPFVQFIPEGGGKPVREKEFWGFTDQEGLCRLDPDAGKLVRMVRLKIEGPVCLWQLRNADLEGESLGDFLMYLTKGINGEIIAMPHGLSSWQGIGIGDYKGFLKDNEKTKYRELCDCLEKERSVKNASECITEFNAEHPAKEKE
jgi:hypothetical protein